jgi:hypothetical protein
MVTGKSRPRRSQGGDTDEPPKSPRLTPSSSLRPLAAARRRGRAKPGCSRRRRASIPRVRGSPAAAARLPGRCAAGGGVGSRGGGLGQASARTTVEVTVRAVPRPVSSGRDGRAQPRADLSLGIADLGLAGPSHGGRRRLAPVPRVRVGFRVSCGGAAVSRFLAALLLQPVLGLPAAGASPMLRGYRLLLG